MKKLSLFFIESMFALLFCAILFSCGGEIVEEIPVYPIAKVSKCERGSLTMTMSYKNTDLSYYHLYENNVLVSSSPVRYTPGIIKCSMMGIDYEIQLKNTRGAFLVESVKATETVNGKISTLYLVQYWFDEENRLKEACINGIETIPIWTNYEYEGNAVVINDFGDMHRIELSAAENLGYVCNVLDFGGARYTSEYIINPVFYFLNIYGKPIGKLPQLPQGEEVIYSEDNTKIVSIGKYSYEY